VVWGVEEGPASSWRRYSTEQGQTQRINEHADHILREGINLAKINNKMFFGSNATGNSEYLAQFDGGVSMARATLATKPQDEASMRAAAEEHWSVVAGSTQKDTRESLMQRLRSTGGLESMDLFAQTVAGEKEKANRQQARQARAERRKGIVLGLRLNYSDNRSEAERASAEAKLTRSLRTKRDSLSARQTTSFEFEGCPGRRSARPVGQEQANRTLLWGGGNAQAKGFTTAETARRMAEIVPLGGDQEREYDTLREGGRLTNAELGFAHKFQQQGQVCTEADLRASNIKLLAACDEQRRLTFDNDMTCVNLPACLPSARGGLNLTPSSVPYRSSRAVGGSGKARWCTNHRP